MLLRALADRISMVTYDTLPAQAVEVAKQGILDTVGVTLAGARDETTAVVAAALRKTAAPGPALIFGTSDHVDVLNAALINGTAAHALDFDDCSNTLGGHPSAPILPALWAIAPAASGKAFIAAYAAGFECETRFARAVNFHHYEKGWHPPRHSERSAAPPRVLTSWRSTSRKSPPRSRLPRRWLRVSRPISAP